VRESQLAFLPRTQSQTTTVRSRRQKPGAIPCSVSTSCPVLAKRLPEETENDLAHAAYRVELDGRRLVWVTHEGDKEVRHKSEPAASRWKRFKVKVLSWLPIEWML
jgi:hypothetical protein